MYACNQTASKKVTGFIVVMFKSGGINIMPEQENLYRAWLHVATFCEKVLRETDGVPSVIRMFDRYNVVGQEEEMPPTILSFTVLVSFKCGILRGKQKVSLRPKTPLGKDMPAMDLPILFEGDDDRGPIVALQLNWSIEEEGLYWWDLYLNEELVTRMPLRVNYQRIGQTTVAS